MYSVEKLLDIVKRINELDNILGNENADKEVFDKAIDESSDIKTDLMRDWNTRFNNYDTARFALDNALDFYHAMESDGDDSYKLNVYMKNRTINTDTYDLLEFESIILHNLRWCVGYVKKESDD